MPISTVSREKINGQFNDWLQLIIQKYKNIREQIESNQETAGSFLAGGLCSICKDHYMV